MQTGFWPFREVKKAVQPEFNMLSLNEMRSGVFEYNRGA
jgi:hypothetical protein